MIPPVKNPIAIIGSGPSGVAARWALEELNCNFEVIDSDLREENEFYKPSEQLFQSGTKLKFGSDLPYRHFRYGPIIQVSNTQIKSSFTRGGLSEVWGATLLPYQKKTIEKWKLEWRDFEEAYTYILRKIPYASHSRKLDSKFEEFGKPNKIDISPIFYRATSIQFDSDLIEIGASRLAIQTADSNSSGCYYCNQCLTGCVAGYIWSAGRNSDNPRTNQSKNFVGFRVIKLFEIDQEIYVEALSNKNEKAKFGPYSKVFLACGPVETFRILSESKYIADNSRLLDSSTFYFPLFARKKVITGNRDGIALSQIYCHLQGESRKKEFHFQAYAQSDVLMERLASILPLAKHIPLTILSKLTSRLVICIGYRESSIDTQIAMTRSNDGNIKCEDAYNISKPKLKKEIRKRLLENKKRFWNAGFYFSGIGIRVGAAGEGVHYGANLQENSDITEDGKVINSCGIYVVDSSALQSISAGPITLTIMANAFRIAKASCK